MFIRIVFNFYKVNFGRRSYALFDVWKINISFIKMKSSCYYVFVLVKKYFINYIKYKLNCKFLEEEF